MRGASAHRRFREATRLSEVLANDGDVLNTFAVVAEPEAVASAMKARYDGLVDRILFSAPVHGAKSGPKSKDPNRWKDALAQFRG